MKIKMDSINNADINIIKNLINDFDLMEEHNKETFKKKISNNVSDYNKKVKNNLKHRVRCEYKTVCASEPIINKCRKSDNISKSKKYKFSNSLDYTRSTVNLKSSASLYSFLKDEENFVANSLLLQKNGSVDHEYVGSDLEQSQDEYGTLKNNLKFESITNITRRKLYGDAKRRQTFVSENVKKASLGYYLL